jgi:acyl transferase domain-containing protein
MPDILIRNISASTKDRLRRRAKRHGRSLEAELREALETIAHQDDQPRQTKPGFGTWLASISRPGADLSEILQDLRSVPIRPVDFE